MTLFPRLIAVLCAGLAATQGLADPLRNTSQFGVDMRAGPGLQFPLIHVLDPGEVADRGRCDLDGKWCLLSAAGKVGWVDTTGLVPPRIVTTQPVAPSGPIESTPLDPGPVVPAPLDPVPIAPAPTEDAPAAPAPAPGVATPLPRSILDAVDGAGTARTIPPPPGSGPPEMFATDAPFYNVTDGLVNLRAGPGTEFDILGELEPGEGGTIDICDRPQRWCRLTGADGSQAWVKMTLVGLRRISVAPLAER